MEFDNVAPGGTTDAPMEQITDDASFDASMLPGSCLAHRMLGSTTSGIYSIDAGSGALDVYCDQTSDGGGWTLVARSVAGGSAALFGWDDGTGAVSDDSVPYSIGPATITIPFTQILVASHAGTKAPVDPIYRVDAAPDFVTAYSEASLRSESATISGSCTPSPFVTMLLFKGFTNLDGVFWFRDVDVVGGTPHGLFPDGWDTFYPGDCMQGGLLHQTQGVIYVR